VRPKLYIHIGGTLFMADYNCYTTFGLGENTFFLLAR